MNYDRYSRQRIRKEKWSVIPSGGVLKLTKQVVIPHDAPRKAGMRKDKSTGG